MAYIYKIINLVNKKIYIGETIRTIDIRWKQHIYKSKNGANGHLYAAMRLYGIDNFTVEEIERCSTEDRFERETYYISKFNSLEPNGYNWILAQHGENSSLIELLFNEWEEGSSLINIGEKFHIDPKRVGYLLKGCGVS